MGERVNKRGTPVKTRSVGRYGTFVYLAGGGVAHVRENALTHPSLSVLFTGLLQGPFQYSLL